MTETLTGGAAAAAAASMFIGGQRVSPEEQIKITGPVKPADSFAAGRLLTAAEILKCYGVPGDPANLTTIQSPYPLRLAWDTRKTVTSITCHKKIAPLLLKILNELLQHYGYKEIKRLGIDLYGGFFVFRPQRGLEKKYEQAIKDKKFSLAYTYLSRHAWAIAGDFDPARNALRTKWKDAQFSKPEYKFFVDTWHKYGFIGYGPERNYDAMHWEIAILIP
jgi:hypothetical protein